MSDFLLSVTLVIVSFVGGVIFREWFKRPKLSFEVSNKRNRTFFFRPVGSELNGKTQYLSYVVIAVWLNSILNRGDETEITDSKLRLKMNDKWSEWFSYVPNKSGSRYDTPYDFAIPLPDSILSRNKKAIVRKNRQLNDEFLLFEPAVTPVDEYYECELKIIPVKGRPATKKFSVYEYSRSGS